MRCSVFLTLLKSGVLTESFTFCILCIFFVYSLYILCIFFVYSLYILSQHPPRVASTRLHASRTLASPLGSSVKQSIRNANQIVDEATFQKFLQCVYSSPFMLYRRQSLGSWYFCNFKCDKTFLATRHDMSRKLEHLYFNCRKYPSIMHPILS